MVVPTPEVPAPIRRAIDAVASINSIFVEPNPVWDPREQCWSLLLRVQTTQTSTFVDVETRWVVLLRDWYPRGEIRFFPAVKGGLTSTFPHQDRNVEAPHARWRLGKPCLDSPTQRLGRVASGPEPKADAELRLSWHVRRLLGWLESAALDQLMVKHEPFEVPQCPKELLDTTFKVVHDEGADTFDAWKGRSGLGTFHWRALSGAKGVIVADRFVDGSVDVRVCRRAFASEDNSVVGYWWLWPEPVVIEPWHAPGTWGELRSIGRRIGVAVDDVLREFARRARAQEAVVILVGYPIPSTWKGAPVEVHWQALLPPPVPSTPRIPRGFRNNARGRWQALRQGVFSDARKLSYLSSENWHPRRLQARGRLADRLVGSRIALIGVGALGSAVAELLARGGVRSLLLIDKELTEVGNLARHTLTAADLGSNKADAVAGRLRLAAPMAEIAAVAGALPGDPLVAQELLASHDVVIDCTAEDDVLQVLMDCWWPLPKLFISASLGFAAERLFLFAATGCSFPFDAFVGDVAPLLGDERRRWADAGEVLEGPGCWSPIFPARGDDVWLAAIATVRKLESRLESGWTGAELTVLGRLEAPAVGFAEEE